MDISLIIKLIAAFSLFCSFHSNAQLMVDTSFIYANYAYKNGRLDFSKKEILQLIPQAKGYDIKRLSVYDGGWASKLMQCNCEVDLQGKTLMIHMPYSYPQLKMSYDSTFKVSGTIDFERGLSGGWVCGNDIDFPNFSGLYPKEAEKIILILNHNPLSPAPPKREEFFFTNKILEGYGLFVEESRNPYANAYPFLFRCLLKQKETVKE